MTGHDCAWCADGTPATASRIIEPEETRRRRSNGQIVTEIVSPARVVHVCALHEQMFDREDRIRTLLQQRGRLLKQRQKPQANERHIDNLLQAVAEKLRELGHVDSYHRPKAAR